MNVNFYGSYLGKGTNERVVVIDVIENSLNEEEYIVVYRLARGHKKRVMKIKDFIKKFERFNFKTKNVVIEFDEQLTN